MIRFVAQLSKKEGDIGMRMYRALLILSISCLSITGIKAATLFITNLLDDGSPGSLRETIANATGGDTIQFSVAGTILLDEALGELIIDKQLTIDGQFKITVDGQNQLNIGFHIFGASASNTLITNITIQNFNGHEVDPGSGTEPLELPAYGILIEFNANNCSVIATTIKNIHSGIAREAIGILSRKDTGDLLDNTIEAISSEDNPTGSSGFVGGIALPSGNIAGNCSNNTIYNLSSGAATSNSGIVIGILAEDGGGDIEGDCTHNTIYNLASGIANNDSGSVIGIFANFIRANCSDNTLYNLKGGSAGNNSFRFFSGINIGVVGIIVPNTITGNCCNNIMYNLTSGQADNISGKVNGITIIISLEGECCNNTIRYLISGDAENTAGGVTGILSLTGTFEKSCSNNTIKYLTTGTGNTSSDPTVGMYVGTILGNCLNNHITNVSTTNTAMTSRTGGIRFTFVEDGSLLACNTITGIMSAQDTQTSGMEVEEANAITIQHNTIDTISNTNGPAYGMYLGSTAENTFFTNSLVFANTVSNITGSNLTGFGISIFGNGSIGNDLLNNSIFAINGKAINIIDNGVPVDATVILQSAVCGNQRIFIRGTLDPEPGFETSEFLLQFFVSDACSPPQTQTFLGQTTITALFSTPFTAKITPCIVIDDTQCITATATALPPGTEQNNNTSEVSNSIPGCDNDFVCVLATTTCDPEPPPCPILIAQ